MKRLLAAALALSLLGGTAAVAQPDRHDDHGGYGQDRNDRGHDDRGHDDRGRDDRSREDRGDRHDNGRHMGEVRGHAWARGERLPRSYYQNRGSYVDYRRHHLRRPPYGYRWVQVDNNYAMVALTSGLISQIINGR